MGLSEIALTGGLVLLGISLLLIAGFGIKNIVGGKHEWTKIAIVLVPFLIFLVTYAVTGQSTESALFTFVSMIGLMLALILFGGLRSTFKS